MGGSGALEPHRTHLQRHSVWQRQHLFDLSQSLTVPIRDAAYKPGQKPKNMRHPGLILPQQLGTSQSLMAFNASKVGTPARLREVAGWVPKQAMLSHNPMRRPEELHLMHPAYPAFP